MPKSKRAAASPRRKPASRKRAASPKTSAAPRKRAASRKSTSRKPAPPPTKRPRGRPRLAPFQSCTAEMEENIRRRYEETDEPVASIADDRGVAPGSLRRIAYAKGWVRRKHRPPKDVTGAMRLLAEAERLEKDVARHLSALPAGGETEDTGSAAASTPTPTLPLAGNPTERAEREHTESGAPASAAIHLADIEQIEAGVRAELATVKATRAAYGAEPYKPYHAQLTARTLSNLTDTIGKLIRLRAALAPRPAATPSAGFAHDDMPADIDEFRHALARRIEAFLESREADGDVERGAAALVVEGAR